MLLPSVNIVDVRRSLLKVKPRKAAGPDNIPGRVLKDCAFQLSEVLTDIFNISLFQAKVPSCFKSTTIIPVPKTSTVSCFNDYRPIALTPILMKCFERLIMDQIKKGIDFSIDPTSMHIRGTDVLRMPSRMWCIWLLPTWKIRTLM